MKKSPLMKFFRYLPSIILLLFSVAFARPFDWQYNRIGTPFAVFYNPSLLGSNPGYTFGLDTRSDDDTYDIRGALTIPVSRVMRRELLLKDNSNRYFRYANQSYRSSKSAVSIGSVYRGPDDYQVSAGFAAPIRLVQSGMSIDVFYKDEQPSGALNLAFNADMPRFMKNNKMLYVGINNLAVSERDGTNDPIFSIGTAGVWTSNPRQFYTPYDMSLDCYIKNGGIDKMVGTARVGLDLTTVHTSRETFGQLPAGALGYRLVRFNGGDVEHHFFINFGITFINKSSSAAILGSYGRGDEKHVAAFYNSFKRGEALGTDSDIRAGLAYNDAGGGRLLFALSSAGTTVRDWVLRIENPKGGTIRTFSGGNVVPSSILWDGLNADGSAMEEELIYVKLVLKGETRVVESNTVGIEFSNGLPVVPKP